MIKERYILICGLLIFIVPFIIYANSFNNQFLAGDDEEIVLRNVYIQSWKYLPNIFTENYKAGAGGITDFWRPFQILTYLIIVTTVGIKPWAFHFSSIMFHSLCGLFLYLILLELFHGTGRGFKSDERKLSLLTITAIVLIWAVHPIHNEELAVTTGIASPTHLFWILSGLYVFINFEKSKKWWWLALSLLCYMLSLCSKESAVIFPGILLGMHIAGIKKGIFEKRNIKKIIYRHGLFWILAILYVALRLTCLNFKNTLNFYDKENIFTENLAYRLYTLFTILAHGLKIIVFPVGLHPERAWPVYTEFFSMQVFISFIIVAAIIIFALLSWKKNPIFTFGIFFFLFSYLPMSNLLAKINALIWDHWFYTPSVGIFISLASILHRKYLEKVSYFILIPGIIIFSGITIHRNPFFKNTEAVSRYILYYEPKTVKTWTNLGMVLADRGETEEAKNCYLKSIELADIYPQTHHNLAMMYVGEGKTGLAENEYLKAISLDPAFYYSYLWLGKLYLGQGRKDEAVKYLKKALEIYPHLPGVKEFLSRMGQ